MRQYSLRTLHYDATAADSPACGAGSACATAYVPRCAPTGPAVLLGRSNDGGFYFSRRRRHTRWPRDWSSDVCSSDLLYAPTSVGGSSFLGQVEPPTLVGAYNAATCVVHTRPDETFGLALAEAMACGRPVLAPASGGPVEVVGDAGVLAASEDPRGFATQLERLLADPGRRAALGAAARRRAVERYSVERMVRDYAELLESLG